MYFEIIGDITDIETIAKGKSIREYKRLVKVYKVARWKKMKGIAMIRINDGSIYKAELHWYEAHGVGKKEIKIKSLLEK